MESKATYSFHPRFCRTILLTTLLALIYSGGASHRAAPLLGGQAAKKSALQKKAPPTRGSKSSSAQSKKSLSSQKKAPGVSKKKLKSPSRRPKESSKQRTSNRSRKSVSKNSEARPRSAEIVLKQEELDNLRAEIRMYQQKLAKLERTEQNTVTRIETFTRQSALIKKLIAQLHVQMNAKQREIDAARTKITDLNATLQRLRTAYKEYVVRHYMRGPTHDTEILLASASLNQMIVRAQYMRAFTARRKSVIDDILLTQRRLEQQNEALRTRLTEQRSIFSEKKSEEEHLVHETKAHTQFLDEVRKNKDKYQRQLEQKREAMREIERLISVLIQREQARRLEKARKKQSALHADRNTKNPRPRELTIRDLPSTPIAQTAFGKLRGRLPWPVSAGSVVGAFGNQVHPTLHTVTINKGIDIAASNGAAVHVVADGVVSMVRFIPGFGNLVLVSHDDGFVTVYARVASVLVKENQRVSAGQSLASVGDSGGASQMHFQIWYEKSVQNPVTWLSKR